MRSCCTKTYAIRRRTQLLSGGRWVPHTRKAMSGDHQLFVCLDDANADSAFVRRNGAGVRVVATRINTDTEIAQIVANPPANRRAVLPDPGGKDERVQAAQHAGEGRQ